MFATATTCKISAVPTARAQRRARRSVAVRAEGAEETAAPVAVRAHRARRARVEREDVWIARAMRGRWTTREGMDRWGRIRVGAWRAVIEERGVARAMRATEVVTTRSIGGRYASVSWAWIDLGG